MVVVVLAAGCWGGSDDRLIGKWHLADGDETLEFLSDGTVLTADSGGPLFGGKWELGEGERLRVTFGGPANYAPPKSYLLELTADTLVVTDDAGKTKTYRRGE
jgi:hypothetical protein